MRNGEGNEEEFLGTEPDKDIYDEWKSKCDSCGYTFAETEYHAITAKNLCEDCYQEALRDDKRHEEEDAESA